MWHLAFVRAIAAATPEGKVTFLAPPSTRAGNCCRRKPASPRRSISSTAARSCGAASTTFGSIALLRHAFHTVWILDKTLRPAVAAFLAGTPERIGLGLGPQSLFITNPGIDRRHFHAMPTDWLIALMAAENVPLPRPNPICRCPPQRRHIGERYARTAALDRGRGGRLASRQGLARSSLAGNSVAAAPTPRWNGVPDRRAAKPTRARG